jgi:two-component system phosphate regulon sensor histidine kinase PhoR
METVLEDSTNLLFSTGTLAMSEDNFQRPLWILPDTYLVIRPQGETYSALIRNRNKTNFYFLLFSVSLVLIGGFLIIRNIRNMIKIAQLKSDFVSNVSHEIRTPISLIRMYAETLMMGRVKEDKKEHYYNVIHHESGRLTYLVNNILDFSRIEANRKTYSREKVNLNDLVEQVYKNYGYTFKEKGVTTSLDLYNRDIMLEVDTAAFDEALSNLIDNAIKYSTDEISIEIKTGVEDSFGYCSVSDKGRGISRSEQQRIFDKFYRVEGAMTQKTKGTGLGLSLVKHMIDAHKGKIEVNSMPGEGSVFILKFPLINN